MSTTTDSMQRSALLSPCGRYRYTLARRWDTGPALVWVMLNPSIADAQRDDPTLRRVTAYTRAWGFGALIVVNLYAYRATDPRDLFTAADPVGPDNDAHLTGALAGREVVAAWGAHARPERVAAFLALHERAPDSGRLLGLALTASGQPRHPLYLPARLTAQPWAPQAA